MSDERWLITGALGCIGAWCSRQLVREGHAVVGFDLSDDRHRAALIMDDDELSAIDYVRGDITDMDAIEQVLAQHRISHVIHLAAMLVPLAAADPPRGALVSRIRQGAPAAESCRSACARHLPDHARRAMKHRCMRNAPGLP